ncbi:TetR/AcrR family transcriptional regulator [Actinacidiphila acididurans]|uniref:TetR/AcrR family transcriptional regulator n=1 Tax=Actinacidiphila acididurans TaxID=2784346 RepID=A0ABS2TX78_9ACTN|nr:TetR/AcrR family transcriptional regulator [Actinacidiphila acididurans]MBM9507939.1 TetR/AcrR family transcriptional regulator [Actinacidiphila acididurans]
MSVQERKERERARRHRLIVATARELAESQGWDAVTTRRLAERIEYSQPVLYSHFRGKREIVGAVALEGFAELAAAMRAAVGGGTGAGPGDGPGPGPGDDSGAGQGAGPGGRDRARVAALAQAYIDFAGRNPALYDAMFLLDSGLAFADEATPPPLREGFQALLDTLTGVSGDAEPGLFTEVFWSCLHGLVTLTRAGRLPPGDASRRLDLLVDRFTRA